MRKLVVLLIVLTTFSILSALPSRAQSNTPAWQPNTFYAVNALVTYNGITYQCRQAHTSQVGWEPPNVLALWLPVSSGNPTNTNAPTRTNTLTPTTGSGGGCSVPAWNSTAVYVGGNQVSYNGHLWQAKWWTQGDVPGGPAGVWTDLGVCHGGGATNTPTSTPTNTRQVTFQPPTNTNTPTKTATGVPPPPPPGKIFAPYIDVSPGASSPIMQLANNGSGNKHYTLAFILGRGCSASWFGTFTMDTSEAAAIGSRINELRSVGGDVIVSFGGAAAPELANVCSDAASLQAQYQVVVSKYNLKYVDFDIEDFSPTAIDIRNKALKGLEAANPGLHVDYTLGVLETGFTQPQMDVLNNAKSNGTRVDLVNIMTMDYGHSVSDMNAAAISAAQGARNQLNTMGFTGTQLGITPMIGVNDSPGETFTLANASSLASWANSNGIAELAFWSVGRDNGSCPGGGAASPSCSGISQSNFQFSSIFHSFAP